jgi:hypothetical protein
LGFLFLYGGKEMYIENYKQISVQEFLDIIHGVNAQIYFQVGSKTWKNKPQTYQQAENNLKWLNSKKNKDICYIVNSGGTTNDSITRINAVFLDWDCGKDDDKNYFPIEMVKEKKMLFLPILQRFPLRPSFVVETRNGFQTYWLVTPDITKEQFIDIQKRIAYYFKGDPEIINPCRVMRLPGYNWVKPHKNCPPFPVNVVSYNPIRYSSIQLFKSFPYVSDEDFQAYRNDRRGRSRKKADRKSAQDNSFSYYNNTCDIYLGTYRQGEPVLDWLKRQDLAKYMNIEVEREITKEQSVSVKCPFHDDGTPSASIYIDKDTGFYMFHCHSEDCGFHGTIIDITAKQYSTNVSESIGILMKYYGIEEDKDWIMNQKEKISKNISIIKDIDQLKSQYTDLHRVINRVASDLLSKLTFAENMVKLKTTRNENIIIASLSTFQKLSYSNSREGDIGRQNERIDRYCLLGLMRKLSNDEVNSSLLKNANEQRNKLAKTKNIRNMYRTQFYTIPEYTPELLKEADKIARTIKEKGILLNAISRDLILQIFGVETAQGIYPQVQTDAISKKGSEFESQVKAILLELMEAHGYCSVKSIVEILQGKYNWKTVTDRRVKKYLPSLIAQLGFKEVVANKTLKEKLNITAEGFPKLIIKKPIKHFSAVVRGNPLQSDNILINPLGKCFMFKNIDFRHFFVNVIAA